MIEIEVEMDVEVTYAEIIGIGEELEKLAEVETLQEQMVYQAEAQDEVTLNHLNHCEVLRFEIQRRCWRSCSFFFFPRLSEC